MEQRDFIYWLQGFAELNKQAPTQEQWDSIREHLQLCFNKVTNPYDLGKLPIAPYYPKGPNTEPFNPMSPYPSIPVIPMTPNNPWDTKKYPGDGEPLKIIC